MLQHLSSAPSRHHEKADLMLEVLRSSGALKSTKLEDSVQLVCFTPANEACLLHTCLQCKTKHTYLAPEISGICV